MGDRLLQAVFHRLCYREAIPATPTTQLSDREFDDLQPSANAFLNRTDWPLSVERKSVLDVGCGGGNLCVEAVRHGATRAVGVDLRPMEETTTRLARRFPDVADRVELVRTEGDLRELGDEQFDVILSKDSFEHYPDPESFVDLLVTRLAPGGVLAVHFAPLWKSPKGGHIEYMTSLPWSHLLFPERVILAERKRFRPDEDAMRFEDVLGGLNKMTLRRFQAIMAGIGLECVFFATNASDRPVVRAMTVAARFPGLREYMTTSVTGLWRKPA